MSDFLYVVRYSGPFGYIKPWTAVRDGRTYSQQFLTPSIIEGLRRKLDVTAILRHRLSFAGMSEQTEEIQPRAAGQVDKRPVPKRGMLLERYELGEGGVLTRFVMVEPVLHLAFATLADAAIAAAQHVCLCRNEDVLLPEGEPIPMNHASFEQIDGFEMLPGREQGAFLAGYNRFADEQGAPFEMWGRIEVVGQAIRDS